MQDQHSLDNEISAAYDILIVGAGTAGISVASSILKRSSSLRIGLLDAAKNLYYQPGWTMVGGGVFEASSTQKALKDYIPQEAQLIAHNADKINTKDNYVTLDNHQLIGYRHLIIASGLVLDWAGIEGLEQSLGANGVTSNYRYDLAPYTWELVQELKQGSAIFSQPVMPIKCAGAPQKALYLSADHWLKENKLNAINIQFCTAGEALFSVKEYIPALQSYMDKYRAQVNFKHNLVKVDGAAKTAWFATCDQQGNEKIMTTKFDMLHVCPPQRAPNFIAESGLADDSGWVAVDKYTLQHSNHDNIWALGDAANTPNAKTMAAVRKQAPVLAENIIHAIQGRALTARYNGYGSCPLTVEKGKIVLAEFLYDGALAPTFPRFLLNGLVPTRTAWILKKNILPHVFWNGMLKGREWLAKPEK